MLYRARRSVNVLVNVGGGDVVWGVVSLVIVGVWTAIVLRVQGVLSSGVG